MDILVFILTVVITAIVCLLLGATIANVQYKLKKLKRKSATNRKRS